jgi:hypothetical protein
MEQTCKGAGIRLYTHTHTHTHTHTLTPYYNEKLVTYVVPNIGLVTVELRGVDELLLYDLFRVYCSGCRASGAGFRG